MTKTIIPEAYVRLAISEGQRERLRVVGYLERKKPKEETSLKNMEAVAYRAVF